MRLDHGNNRKLGFHIGDVRRPESLLDAMVGVDFVCHAAALKQVPSCEFYPMEAPMTNAVGAKNVMNAAMTAGVRNVVVLSTDKAGRRSHQIHGISKAMYDGEAGRGQGACGHRLRLYHQYHPLRQCDGLARLPAARFDTLFVEQIKSGTPLTVTDPHMTRFMMSIDDTVDLVL